MKWHSMSLLVQKRKFKNEISIMNDNSVGKEVEQLELSYNTAAENINWKNHFRKLLGGIS